MNKQSWELLSDKDLDDVLKNSMPELPPEDIVEEVTPWKKSMNRVLTGLTLNSFTISIFYLNYILPAIGVFLCLFGFRALQKENKWFKCCYIFSGIQILLTYINLIGNTTVYAGEIKANPYLTILIVAIRFCLLICFWRGLTAIGRKVDFPVKTGGAIALICWNGVIVLLALWGYSYIGYLSFALVIISLICIISNMNNLAEILDEAGYTIEPASVKMSDRTVGWCVVIVLILGCLLGYLFGHKYPMDWKLQDAEEHAQVQEIKSQLLALGFPENVLNDLSAQDIKACERASQIQVNIYEYPINPGRQVPKNYGPDSDGTTEIIYVTEYDVKELRFTEILVGFPAKQGEWRVFHHFCWTVNPGFCGTETIQLWPVYGHSDKCKQASGVTGRVLYDKDGESYVAPYIALEKVTYTSHDWAFGNQINTNYFADFAMPSQGENHRGYLTYSIRDLEDEFVISSFANYIHQKSRLQYPVKTAREDCMEGQSMFGETFVMIQDVMDFSSDEEGVGTIERDE